MRNKIKVLAATAAALVTAVVQAGTATAATQFPSSGAGGITVDWSGQWENLNRLDQLSVALCDQNTSDRNEAVARLEVILYNSQGQARTQLAPVVMRVEQYAAQCKGYKNMYLGYGDTLGWVRVLYYGSVDGTEHYTKWVENPFMNG